MPFSNRVVRERPRQRRSVLLVVMIAATVLGGCRQSAKREGPEALFRRWNALATAGDAKAKSLVCAAPTSDETNETITRYSSGFAVLSGSSSTSSPSLNVNVDDAAGRAVIDFSDPGTPAPDDDQDVFVSMVTEGGTWKVCTVQITAAGGIG
jgi:hypothetical protein